MRGSLVTKLGIIFTLTLVLLAYYWIHKPITPTQLSAIASLLHDVLVVAVLTVAAGGIGRRSLEWLPLNALSAPEKIAIEGLFGFGIISLAALVAGLIDLFNGTALWVIVILGGMISLRGISWVSDLLKTVQKAINLTSSQWSRFLMWAVIIMMVCGAISAIVPPHSWDSLAYHLYGPKLYLQSGRIVADPNNFFLGLPQSVEMLYAIVLSAGTDTAAASIHFVFACFALVLVGGAVWRVTRSVDTTWFAIILPLTSFGVWELTGTPYVDLAVMAFSTAAILCAIQWRESGIVRWLIMAGCLGGFAFSTKYTSAIVLVSIALFILIIELRKRRFPLRELGLLSVSAGLVYALWAVKGVVLYGNPIYPFLFNGLNWDPIRTRLFLSPQLGLLPTGLGWQLPIIPFTATIFGINQGVVFSSPYVFTLGPWLFTLPFLLIFVWRKLDDSTRRLASSLLLIGIPIVLYWMYSAATSVIGIQTRLMTSGFGIAAILGALAIHSFGGFPKFPLNLTPIVRALLAITIIFVLLNVITITVEGEGMTYAAIPDREGYLSRRLFTYMDAMHELSTLPQGSKVRLMWEPRGYYCPANVECIPDVVIDFWRNPMEHGLTPDDAFMKWKSAGEQYLLVAEFQVKQLETIPDYGYPSFHPILDKWMKPVWSDPAGTYVLYTWKD